MLFDWTHIWWNAPNTITKYMCSVQKTVNPHTHTQSPSLCCALLRSSLGVRSPSIFLRKWQERMTKPQPWPFVHPNAHRSSTCLYWRKESRTQSPELARTAWCLSRALEKPTIHSGANRGVNFKVPVEMRGLWDIRGTDPYADQHGSLDNSFTSKPEKKISRCPFVPVESSRNKLQRPRLGSALMTQVFSACNLLSGTL